MSIKSRKDPIHLDGTTLEGGGQLLRIAIGLSALSSLPIQVTQIRGNRSKGGGLKLQHLRAVEWLAKHSGADLSGAEKGSKELEMWPQLVQPSAPITAQIDIGSPGSIGLVFQAIVPYLIFAGAQHQQDRNDPISITIKGGTNVSNSPSHDYITQVLLPTLAKIGLPPITATHAQRGWSTGRTEMGSVTFSVTPLPAGKTFPAFELVERGAIPRIEATVLAPRAGWRILREELDRRVGDKFPDVEFGVQFEDSGDGKRLYLLLVAISADGHRLGRDLLYDQKIKNISDAATRLVKRVVDELGDEVEHGGCVDEYMRDQLVIFQALADGRCEIESGRSEDGRNVKPSLHTLTAHWVAHQLLGVQFDRDGICDGIGFKARGEPLRKGNEVEGMVRDLEKVDILKESPLH